METKIEKSCSAHSACFTPLVGIPQCFPSLVPHTPLSLVHTRTQPTNRLSYPIQPKPSLSRSLDLVAHSSRNAQGSQARSSRPPLWHRNAWSRQEGYVLSPSLSRSHLPRHSFALTQSLATTRRPCRQGWMGQARRRGAAHQGPRQGRSQLQRGRGRRPGRGVGRRRRRRCVTRSTSAISRESENEKEIPRAYTRHESFPCHSVAAVATDIVATVATTTCASLSIKLALAVVAVSQPLSFSRSLACRRYDAIYLLPSRSHPSKPTVMYS